MELVVICSVAFAASALTLVSGFGLGTLLTPVFALFFPIEAAVAMTALVHLANSLFKMGLVGRNAAWRIVLRFGIPAAAAAFAGAGLLVYVADLAPIAVYEALGRERTVMPVKLVIGVLIVVFALLELSPRFARLAIPAKYLPWGGGSVGVLWRPLRQSGRLSVGVTDQSGPRQVSLCRDRRGLRGAY